MEYVTLAIQLFELFVLVAILLRMGGGLNELRLRTDNHEMRLTNVERQRPVSFDAKSTELIVKEVMSLEMRPIHEWISAKNEQDIENRSLLVDMATALNRLSPKHDDPTDTPPRGERTPSRTAIDGHAQGSA